MKTAILIPVTQASESELRSTIDEVRKKLSLKTEAFLVPVRGSSISKEELTGIAERLDSVRVFGGEGESYTDALRLGAENLDFDFLYLVSIGETGVLTGEDFFTASALRLLTELTETVDFVAAAHNYDEEKTASFYKKCVRYVNAVSDTQSYVINKAVFDEKIQILYRKFDFDIVLKRFDEREKEGYFEFVSPLTTIKNRFPKILIYNWLPFDNPWNWGGGVTVYCRNLIDSFIKYYPSAQIYFLSSGFAYDATRTDTYYRKIDSVFGENCKQYEIVNSPVPAEQRNLYVNPLVYLKNETLKRLVKHFIDTHGPFTAIHFNNFEGLSLDCFDLKKDYKSTKFIFSVHNYNAFCLTGGYFMRHKHCVCNASHTGNDCFRCSRADIKSNIADITYERGLYGADPNRLIERKKWIESFAFERLDNDVNDDNILDFAKTATAKINENCDYILAVSKRVYELAKNEGFNAEKMYVSYIGTKVAERQTNKANAKPGDFLRLVFLGNDLYYEEKGYPFLLNALEKLDKERAAKVELVLTMKQNEDEKVTARLKRFKSVKIIHGYKHADLPEIFEGCHLSVVPVVWEDNLPQIAIESVAYGVPVLASDFGGASELCSSDAFKFKGGDEESFLEKLRFFIDNPQELANYWRFHNGLVTLKRHLNEMLHYYGLPATQKCLAIGADDYGALCKERNYYKNRRSEAAITAEEAYKIDVYNRHTRSVELLDKEKIELNRFSVKLLKFIDKLFPKGSKRRAFLRKILTKRGRKQ